MSLNKNPKIGDKNSEKKNIKISRKIIEYCSIESIAREKDCGSNGKSILDPSSGGIGTKLKIANAKFMMTIE